MKIQLEQLRQSFGYTIKRLRRERGITQAELACRSKIDRSYLSALESGSRNIALNNIWQLATAFGMRPSALLKTVESNLSNDSVGNVLKQNSIAFQPEQHEDTKSDSVIGD